nr:MAG TPA: hypothetical protein [Caudoviricetes sp.]
MAIKCPCVTLCACHVTRTKNRGRAALRSRLVVFTPCLAQGRAWGRRCASREVG